jgi:hypothetical protein
MKKVSQLMLVVALVSTIFLPAFVSAGLFKALKCSLGDSYLYVWPASMHKDWEAKAAKGVKATAIGFSLRNKTKKPIYVMIKNNSFGYEQQKELIGKVKGLVTKNEAIYPVEPDQFLDLPMNVSNYTTLKILNASTLNEAKEATATNKAPVLSATFTPDKTMYVNWDGTSLYPQQGPLSGKANVTDRCYGLNKNVKKEDIRK